MPQAQRQTSDRCPSNPMSIGSILNDDRQVKSTQRLHHHHQQADSNLQSDQSNIALRIRLPTSRRESVDSSSCESTSATADSSPSSTDAVYFPSQSSMGSSLPGSLSARPDVLPEKRPPRHKYTTEQMVFVWYHRTDLREPWDVVRRRFTAQFPETRTKLGLECKYYRLLSEYGVAKVREQARNTGAESDETSSRNSKYGPIHLTCMRYSWMRDSDQNTEPLLGFRGSVL